MENIGIFLIFLIYLIAWIFVPGMLIQESLLPRRLRFSTRMLASFFMGFFLMAVLYYIESAIGIHGVIMVAGPVFTVVWIIKWIKSGRQSLFNATEHFMLIYLILFIFLFVVSMLSFQLKYIGALSGVTTQVYHDYLFHTGNIVSLSRSFPNNDIRIEGLTFYYHYFYELIFAMCKHIFGMDAFRLYMDGNALVTAFPLTCALVTVGERIRGAKIVGGFRYFVYCAGLLVSCVCMLPLNVVGGTFPISWMDNHFYTNGNAMGLALSLTVLVTDILVEIWYDKYCHRRALAMFILTAIATGFKGTTGILLVAIAWVVFVVETILKKRFEKQQLIYNTAMTLGFIVTYVFVTVGLDSSGANNRSMTLSPYGTIEAGRVGQILTKLGIDYTFWPITILASILCGICIVGPLIIPFVLFVYSRFKKLIEEKTIGNIFDWFAIGSVIMGIIGFCVITVPGLSQGYFVITNSAFIFYCSIKYIRESRNRAITIYTYCFLIFGTVFLVCDIGYYVYSDIQQAEVYQQDAGDADDLVSAQTMEAYLWLRDNTAEDSLVAVDRLTESLDYRSIYFYCSAFSERQCFIEGYDYSDISEDAVSAMLSINDKFYIEDSLEAYSAMELVGVDYLVVTKHSHPDFYPQGSYLKLVFTNDEVQIYHFEP